MDPRTIRVRPILRLQWRRPSRLDGSVELVERGSESEQRGIQAERQRSVLAHIYFSIASLPSTPAEPDPEPKDVVVAVTRPIPLEVVPPKKPAEPPVTNPCSDPAPPQSITVDHDDQCGASGHNHAPADSVGTPTRKDQHVHVQTPIVNVVCSEDATAPLSGAAVSALIDQGRGPHVANVEIPDLRENATTPRLTPAEMSTLTMLPWQPVTGEQWPDTQVSKTTPTFLFSAAEISSFKAELRSTGRVRCPIEGCQRKYMRVSSLNRHLRESQEHGSLSGNSATHFSDSHTHNLGGSGASRLGGSHVQHVSDGSTNHLDYIGGQHLGATPPGRASGECSIVARGLLSDENSIVKEGLSSGNSSVVTQRLSSGESSVVTQRLSSGESSVVTQGLPNGESSITMQGLSNGESPVLLQVFSSGECSIVRQECGRYTNGEDSKQNTPFRGQWKFTGCLQCPFEGCQRMYMTPRSLNRHLCTHSVTMEGEEDPDRFSTWLPGFTNSEVTVMRKTLRTTGSLPCPIQGCLRMLKSTKGIRYHILRHSVPTQRRSDIAPCQEGERFIGFTTDEVTEFRKKIRSGGSVKCPIEGCHRMYKSLDGLNCHMLYKHSGLPGTKHYHHSGLLGTKHYQPTVDENLMVRINLASLVADEVPDDLSCSVTETTDTTGQPSQDGDLETSTENIESHGDRSGGERIKEEMEEEEEEGKEKPMVVVKEEKKDDWEVMVVEKEGERVRRVEGDHQLALWRKKSIKLIEYMQGCR